MKRKLMAVILAAGLAVSMAGCSGGAPAPQGSSDSAEGETVEDTAEMGEESGGGVETGNSPGATLIWGLKTHSPQRSEIHL